MSQKNENKKYKKVRQNDRKMKKIFSFQISTRTVDTVSSSYSAITDTYNSILKPTDQFVFFEIPKKNTPTAPL